MYFLCRETMDRKDSYVKRKAPGFADRQVRAKFNQQKSRTNREELLASKRRIPLSVLQDKDQSIVESKKPLSTKERSDLRLEKLKEWKRLREEAKNKDRKDKKVMFKFGVANKPFSTSNSVSAVSNNIFQSKPKSEICKNGPIKQKPSIVSSKVSVACMSTAPGAKKAATVAPKIATQPRSNRAIGPPTKYSNSKPSSQPQSKRAVGPPTNFSNSKPSSRVQKAPPVARVSSRLLSKLKKDEGTTSVVSVTTRPQTRSISKLASRNPPPKAATNYGKASHTKAEPQSKSKKTTGVRKGAVSSRTVSTRNTKKEHTVNKIVDTSNRIVSACNTKKGHTDDEIMDISIEISNPPATDTEEGNVSPPPTPKGKNYAPVCPSPLLRSTSARRRETLFSAPRDISDPAWIPGLTAEPRFNQPNFDEAFGNEFSPFRFGNSDLSFQFTFRKSPSCQLSSFSSDSLCETSTTNPCVTPDSKIVRHSLGSSGNPVRHITTNEDEMVVEVVAEESSKEEFTSVKAMEVVMSEAETNDVEEPVIDIPYFKKLHSDVTDVLTALCDKWDEKVTGLETDMTDGGVGMEEEVLGQLRTTVGQGRLLMRKKMKQYLGLVDIAEKQSGERKTTSEDLQGFWDMVYFQVEDVYQKFKCAEKIEENGWKMQQLTPKQKRTKKRQTTGKTVNTNRGEETERQKAAKEKREAQRNQLREMRQAAKREWEVSSGTCEQENSITSPKKSKTDDSPPKSGSAFRKGRRCSMRLRDNSIFSPCISNVSQQVDQDVPIATLILFDD